MKKSIIFSLLMVLSFIQCEKDDICLEDTTPNLIIRFYNFDTPSEVKKVNQLTVWASEKDSLYVSSSLDSIAIPLNLSENTTHFKLASGTTVDDLILNYNRNDIFVSRSCGYKTVYSNLENSSNSTNWIKSIAIKNTTIDNETAAHITIYH